MALPTRRSYAGAADICTLSSLISAGATTATLIGSLQYWPSVGTGPFYIVIDPGLTVEEKVLVTNVVGQTLTISRGQDNTQAAQHSAGATCYPVGAAVDFDEANSALSKMTTKGDLLVTTGSVYARLPVGTDTYSLLADSGAANGVAWGQIAAGGIATGAVTSAKILDATIVQADLALTLLKALCPVGSINAYAGATAPTGWILCNGTAVVSGTHPELFALCATTPDLRGSFALGKTATGTGSTLLGTGGSTTIAEANLPSHTHTNSASFAGSSGQSTSNTAVIHNHQQAAGIATQTLNLTMGATSLTMIDPNGSYTPNTQNNVDTVGHNHGFTAAGTVAMTNATTGSGTAYYQPFLAVNYIIKHDYV